MPMAVVAEVITTGSILGLIALGFRWLYSRITKMEKSHKQDLYQVNGQTNYISRNECRAIQHAFCDKVDEVKALIIAMDAKREDAKDEYHAGQVLIEGRLAAIEARLP